MDDMFGKPLPSDKEIKDDGSQQLADTDNAVTFAPITVSCAQNDHNFIHQTANMVKCRNCPVGYALGPGSHVKNGHIYIGSQLLI